jgi:hypothetical protein
MAKPALGSGRDIAIEVFCEQGQPANCPGSPAGGHRIEAACGECVAPAMKRCADWSRRANQSARCFSVQPPVQKYSDFPKTQITL